jgi:hypothetical protein
MRASISLEITAPDHPSTTVLVLPPPPKALPDETRVVRVMPNTPCLVGQSAAAFALGDVATAEDQAVVRRIFSAVGIAVEVKEKDLNGKG